MFRKIVIENGKIDYINDFAYYDQKILKNTAHLVGILYEMCKVNLVIPADNEEELNTINYDDIEKI